MRDFCHTGNPWTLTFQAEYSIPRPLAMQQAYEYHEQMHTDDMVRGRHTRLRSWKPIEG